MKKKVIALILVALACVSIWLAINAAQNAALAWCLALVCIVLAVLMWKGKKQAPKEQPQATPVYSFVNFNLSGVTYPNDEGVSRQDLIRRIDNAQPPFENSGSLDVDLKPIKFRGRGCNRMPCEWLSDWICAKRHGARSAGSHKKAGCYNLRLSGGRRRGWLKLWCQHGCAL